MRITRGVLGTANSDWRCLVLSRHKLVTRQFHDGPNKMGHLRLGCGGDRSGTALVSETATGRMNPALQVRQFEGPSGNTPSKAANARISCKL
jgi:hypothetical protein